ncbi:hypothetical protein EV421DRAFT_1942139 [Armillaria borealis]|uniref:Uncharacterized protein n=1 Tax=Armillaria borealis TaxID=47425 RepID=A0AA39K9B8_9AGAR|nr:hypothetical protein EV421DRAFT_1942139 [Armillaria borealis]
MIRKSMTCLLGRSKAVQIAISLSLTLLFLFCFQGMGRPLSDESPTVDPSLLAFEHVLAGAIPDYLPPPNVKKGDLINKIQESLLCGLKTGERVRVEAVEHVRQFRGSLSSSPLNCAFTSLTMEDLCTLHIAKRITFVGPELTYHLHLLWLHALSSYEHRSHPCRGQEFCTFHHICQLPFNGTGRVEKVIDSRDQRFQKSPSGRELIESGSSIVRYIMSTSLYLSSNKNDIRYTLPYVNPLTGVRTRDTFWLHQARKADVILMNRGPIPAPAWTYDGTLHGNWSYIDCLHLNGSATVDFASRLNTRVRILNAALHATLTQFLPELHRTLRTIHTDQDIRRKCNLWIWHGSVQCNKDFSASNPWSVYYEAQVYMHNYILSKILPHYGILFLPLPSVESVECWRLSPDTPLGDSIEHDFFSRLGHIFRMKRREATKMDFHPA